MAGQTLSAQLRAPDLASVVDELAALLRQDAELRALQAQNAPRACYFDRQTLGAGNFVNVPYSIAEAQTGSQKFSSLVVTFDTAAGLGFWRVDIPASLTAGVEIPAGGGTLQINGFDNIKNFTMINQAGQTLPFSRYLYL